MKLVRVIGAALLVAAPLVVVAGPTGAQDGGCTPETFEIDSPILFTPNNGRSQTPWEDVDWPAGSVITSTIRVEDLGHITDRDLNSNQFNETISIRFALSGGGIVATTPTPDLALDDFEDGPFQFTITAPADIVRVRMSHGWYVNGLDGDIRNSIRGIAQITCAAQQETTTTTTPDVTTPPPPVTEATTTTEVTTTTTETTTTSTEVTTTTEATTSTTAPTTSTTAPQSTTQPPGGGGGGGELPRTGPNDGLIRIGLLLGGAGAALLLVERVGFRDAR